MNPPSTVAIVRSNNRRGAVAEALALIAGDLARPFPPEVTVLPDFASIHQPWAWTQPDTISATLDALFSWGASQVVVRAPDHRTLDRSRIRPETLGRAVRHEVDADRDSAAAWSEINLDPGDGHPIALRVERPQALVSITTMKSNATSAGPLGLANLLNLVHPGDRVAIKPDDRRGSGERSVADFAKGAISRLRALAHRFSEQALRRVHTEAVALPREAERSGCLIAGLADIARPMLSVVDGFIALGVVVAGWNPVAVDAVAAAVMGFDPTEFFHPPQASAGGLGAFDFDSISIVGDSLASVQRCCVPHSNRLVDLLRLSKRDSIVPAPHPRPTRSSRPTSR